MLKTTHHTPTAGAMGHWPNLTYLDLNMSGPLFLEKTTATGGDVGPGAR